MLVETKEFQTVAEFNRMYDLVREDILKRHEIKKGTKVRLKHAMMLYQDMNGEWIPMTSVKSDMIDRIKMNETLETGNKFKLKATV